jgi:hypothetical protein
MVGRDEEAAISQECALAIHGDPIGAQYSLASGNAIAGRHKEALQILRQIAPQMDDRWKKTALADWNFIELRDYPEFQGLMSPSGD